MGINQFNPSHPLKTPILILIFNRLDTTIKVFDEIRKAKPPRLYIASDGPRDNIEGETEKVKAVRDYVMNSIDWPCEVKTLFRSKNLGCGKAVSSAITWFFDNEEMGIILEDDTLPSQSFFWFCEELLHKYKDDFRIWHIAGNNFHSGWMRDSDYSYYFSYYGSIWGWATWNSRWRYYDFNIKSYDEIKSKKYLFDVFGNIEEANFRISNFDAIKRGFDTWDFQWAYARLINSGLSIVPIFNMVKNIGFGVNATHTYSSKDKRSNMPIYDIDLPLKHPNFIIRDKISDDRFFKNYIKFDENILKKFLKRVFKR